MEENNKEEKDNKININKLTLREKIGQMFIVGIPGTEIDDITKQLITEYKVGGVILYKKNILNLEHFVDLLNNLRKLNRNNKVPLIIAIDQEGGRVNRMPSEIDNLLNAKQIARVGGAELCYKSGKVIGEILSQFNINMNFAPVLDIGRFKDNHPLGDRCIGENADEVSKNGIALMNGIKSQKVISTIKHFPGHGASKIDSHIFMPTVYKSIKKLKKEDMLPYINAIKAGADSVMVGHLLIANVNSIYPASLSEQVITKILKIDLKYDGLVITDDLSMKGITLFFGLIHASTKAIVSGADMLVINKEHKNKIRIMENLFRMCNENNNFLNTRINQSVKKIIDIKEKYKVKDAYITDYNIEKINKEIKEINNLARK